MATTPTNSTTVSLLDLPVAQLATAKDYLILQTANGTQIIPFGYFNVVHTDIAGNATVVGDLTGNNATFFGNVAVITLSASSLVSSYGRPGWTDMAPICAGNNFYDSFTIQNGLIVSATPTIYDYKNNPIYITTNAQLTSLSATLNTQLTSMSATFNMQLTSVSANAHTELQTVSSNLVTTIQILTAGLVNTTYDNTQIIQFTNSTPTTAMAQWSNFFAANSPTQGLVIGDSGINNASFNIVPKTLPDGSMKNNAQPFVYNILQSGTTLQAYVSAPYTPFSTAQYYTRLFLTFST